MHVRFDPLNEKIASKQHAFIEAKPDGFYITDNTSTNGTYVNGERIQTVRLKSGDQIQFGRNGTTGRILIEIPAYNQSQSEPTVFHPNADSGQFQAAPTQFTPVNQIPQLSFKNTLSGLGVNQVEIAPEPPRSLTKKYVVIGMTIFGIVFMSLIVMVLMFFSVGPVAAVIASVIAFIPAMFYLIAVAVARPI